MKFSFTMNCPTRTVKDGLQNLVHQVIGEIDDGDCTIENERELLSHMEERRFISVAEFYKGKSGDLVFSRITLLNTDHVAKASEYVDD